MPPPCVVRTHAASLINTFSGYGPLTVEWPGKDGKHPRCPPKGNVAKGNDELVGKLHSFFAVVGCGGDGTVVRTRCDGECCCRPLSLPGACVCTHSSKPEGEGPHGEALFLKAPCLDHFPFLSFHTRSTS